MLRVWPEPPARARIGLVQIITGPADWGLTSGSFLGRVAKGLAGRAAGADRLVQPQGIAVDAQGNLLVSDTAEAAVCFFDRSHKRYYRWAKIGKWQLSQPVAVATEKDLFYVADSALGVVIGFTLKGKPVLEISKPLSRPTGIAVSGSHVYVADAQLHQVFVFDLKGAQTGSFGGRGSGPGQLNYPTHVAVAGSEVVVTDAMNSRIVRFDLSGKYLGSIGSAGNTSGHFSRPKGVALDRSDRVYVVDALLGNVQIFDREGKLLLPFGEAGSEPGQLWLPNGIAIGNDDRIYVADTYNHRVQVFKYIGP